MTSKQAAYLQMQGPPKVCGSAVQLASAVCSLLVQMVRGSTWLGADSKRPSAAHASAQTNRVKSLAQGTCTACTGTHLCQHCHPQLLTGACWQVHSCPQLLICVLRVNVELYVHLQGKRRDKEASGCAYATGQPEALQPLSRCACGDLRIARAQSRAGSAYI